MTEERWGAWPADWNFWIEEGYGPDLLPVVSNPRAELSPNSKLGADFSKVPSRYNGAGLVVGFHEWRQYEATPADLLRWMNQPDYGICVNTRNLRAIDIDIEDPWTALEVAETFARRFGHGSEARVRWREGSGRLLLPVGLAPGDPTLTKRDFKHPGGTVEFLATGQQFVAVGTHKSGERLQWGTLAEVRASRGVRLA